MAGCGSQRTDAATPSSPVEAARDYARALYVNDDCSTAKALSDMDSTSADCTSIARAAKLGASRGHVGAIRLVKTCRGAAAGIATSATGGAVTFPMTCVHLSVRWSDCSASANGKPSLAHIDDEMNIFVRRAPNGWRVYGFSVDGGSSTATTRVCPT